MRIPWGYFVAFPTMSDVYYLDYGDYDDYYYDDDDDDDDDHELRHYADDRDDEDDQAMQCLEEHHIHAELAELRSDLSEIAELFAEHRNVESELNNA